VRYRPGYPPALAAFLAADLDLSPPAHIADVGSGTGKLSALLLDAGYRVTAVEPGDAMRAAAERDLGDRSGFVSVTGRAEATGLPDGCADAVTVAQAFHWFDVAPARKELVRLLRPGAPVLLIWNDRATDRCPLLADYEQLLRRHAPEYQALERRESGENRVRAFFAPNDVHSACFEFIQRLDWDGVRGRALSSSYVPRSGADHDALLSGLEASFRQHASDGHVDFVYDTRVFWSRPT
jgi:SAM-dependent methyltransferase